jgi:hypothetical protein
MIQQETLSEIISQLNSLEQAKLQVSFWEIAPTML